MRFTKKLRCFSKRRAIHLDRIRVRQRLTWEITVVDASLLELRVVAAIVLLRAQNSVARGDHRSSMGCWSLGMEMLLRRLTVVKARGVLLRAGGVAEAAVTEECLLVVAAVGWRRRALDGPRGRLSADVRAGWVRGRAVEVLVRMRLLVRRRARF